MAASCKFCDQEFSNPQGVRAHLKGCEAYRETKGGGVVAVAARGDEQQEPRGSGGRAARVANIPVSKGRRRKATGGFSRADQIEDEVAASEARLRLRQVEAAHR